MKTEDLRAMGLTDEQISKVMAENGKDINSAKAKFADYDSLKEQLANANKQIEEFKGMDIDGVRKSAEEWKQKAEQAEKDAAEKISNMERSQAEEAYASTLKFSSGAAKKAFLADLAGKKLPLQDGKLLGADDFTKAYKEADSAAFANDTPSVQVVLPGGNPTPETDPRKMNYTELCAYLEKHPEAKF